MCRSNRLALLNAGRNISAKNGDNGDDYQQFDEGEPGTLKAVGRSNGNDICEFVLKTAGSPGRIELLPDTTQLRADGKDVSQIEFRLVDENGVRVPNADAQVKFDLTGPAKIIGLGNGDLSNSENCQGDTHRTFQGRGVAILQSTGIAGSIRLQASAPGLQPATVTLKSQ
jgi:beta-galactosidase